MKKSISVLILLALVTTGAFAQIGLSAGGGLLFDGSFRNGMEYDGDFWGADIASFGGFAFFDATYAQVDIAFLYGIVTGVAEIDGDRETDKAGSMMSLSFSLLGKYPIELGPVTLFPLLGVGYNLVLESKDEDGNKAESDDLKDIHQLGFLAGVGVDYPLNDNLYLRAEALFSLRLPTKQMTDAVKDSDATATLGIGPRIKVGVGYRF